MNHLHHPIRSPFVRGFDDAFDAFSRNMSANTLGRGLDITSGVGCRTFLGSTSFINFTGISGEAYSAIVAEAFDGVMGLICGA